MKTSVITGGAGFIGSHIARRLVKENHQVIIIDNLCEGKLENIEDIKNKVKFYKEDILLAQRVCDELRSDNKNAILGLYNIYHPFFLEFTRLSVQDSGF